MIHYLFFLNYVNLWIKSFDAGYTQPQMHTPQAIVMYDQFEYWIEHM